jgi:hypothetical protein
MAKHTSSTLQDRLARSLDQANRREAAKPKAALPAKLPLPAERRCTKLSVSLFSGDVARLDAIRDLMAQNGVRLSTSQAVKLALRTAPLDAAAMRQALDAIRSEDGRKL